MAFPTTSVLDDFNRANAGPPPSASWGGPIISGGGGIVLVSNAVKGNASGGSQAYWLSSFGADQEAWYTLTTRPQENNNFQIFLRLSNPNSGSDTSYVLNGNSFFSNTIVSINTCAAGTLTAIGSLPTLTINAGDQIGFSASGSTLTGYVNGTSVITRTDSTYSTGGYIGVGVTSTTAVLDAFGGGAIVTGTSRPVAPIMKPQAVTRASRW